MSWSNILLDYPQYLEAYQKIEKLDQGSQYEHKAVDYFLEKNLREAYGCLQSISKGEELKVLCKAEAKVAMPTLTDQELEDLANSRNNQINNLTLEIVKIAKEASDAHVESRLKAALERSYCKCDEQLIDAKIDAMIEAHESKLEPGFLNELLKKIYPENEIRQQVITRLKGGKQSE